MSKAELPSEEANEFHNPYSQEDTELWEAFESGVLAAMAKLYKHGKSLYSEGARFIAVPAEDIDRWAKNSSDNALQIGEQSHDTY